MQRPAQGKSTSVTADVITACCWPPSTGLAAACPGGRLGTPGTGAEAREGAPGPRCGGRRTAGSTAFEEQESVPIAHTKCLQMCFQRETPGRKSP